MKRLFTLFLSIVASVGAMVAEGVWTKISNLEHYTIESGTSKVTEMVYFTKIRINFTEASSDYGYITIKSKDTYPWVEVCPFYYKECGDISTVMVNTPYNYYIQEDSETRTSKSKLFTKGTKVDGMVKEFDMNTLAETEDEQFYVSSWQKNVVSDNIEIYVEAPTPEPCITASGTCGAEGDNVVWELSCDGVLTISGTGAMEDYPSSTTKPWAEFRTIIKELVVKEGVTSIGDRSFSAGTAHLNEGYKIESLTLPNSLTRIGQFAFFDCTTLASLQIPENVESIGYAAFYDCNLTSVFIPASVTNIEKSAFEDNTFLASMEVENGNLVYDSREDCNAIIETASNTLISGCQNSVIPVGIVAIGDAAFRQCSRLTAITFPEGIKTIGPNAFDECSGLTSIELPEGVTTIGEIAFHSCLNVTSVILPNSLTRIGASAFANCRKLTSITIPSNVTVLGNLCFAANDRTLTTVTFEPITPPAMGEQCFNTTYCQFYVPCGTKNTYVKALGVWSGKVFEPQDCTMELSCPFTGTCGDNLTWTLDCEGVLTISGTGEMYSYTELGTQPWSDHLESVFSIIVKEGVTSIGDRVFAGCISVTTIEIPNSATSIGYGAFYNCRSLTSIEIPNSVTSIGQEAFGNCSNLSSVEIPNGIENIGIEVFYGCYSLTSVKIPNNVTIIEWGAFWGCKSLTSIEIPNSVKQIAWIAFSGCSGLASITCNAIAPPVLGENVFLNVDKSIPLYVPLQSVEAYKAADGWKDFFNILPIGGQEECKYETTDGTTVWEDELPFTWEDKTFTEAGTQTTTLKSMDGCDSIVTFTLRVRYRNIVLQENEDAQYYDFFAEDYNGYTVNTATLNRQFTQGKWATLCLPFDVRKGQMISLGLYGRVFEFRYAEMMENNTIATHFAVAQSIEAGKGYIVNANAKLAQKTSFVFPGVTVNTDADNGDIATLTGYNDNSGRGSICMVGTLRTGTLYNYAGGNTYLGLKDNKLYYPNTTTGTAVRAYRGFFRSGIGGVIEEGDDDDEPAAPQRVRIVVEGETVTELEVMNGEADMQDVQPARKFINNGILYIERNGKTYTAQGAELR